MSKTTTKKKEKFLTILEASEKANRTILSIHLAIKNGSLLAQKDPKTKGLMVEESELERYSKKGRTHRRYKGKLLYDKDKGEYTMEEVAEILKLDPFDLYYEVRSLTNELKYSIKGKNYKVFHIDDIKAFEKLLIERKKQKKK
uniref:Uncharacterized protein n=1 Tax=Candidatus Kentrum sp. SD TaxID=2126332 RepID=A0A450YV04_9GAMM|nr:MAG: hypothetical protein BECKSD772F_GA0070984_12181 [Candidatus Kentron sp. SD]